MSIHVLQKDIRVAAGPELRTHSPVTYPLDLDTSRSKTSMISYPVRPYLSVQCTDICFQCSRYPVFCFLHNEIIFSIVDQGLSLIWAGLLLHSTKYFTPHVYSCLHHAWLTMRQTINYELFKLGPRFNFELFAQFQMVGRGCQLSHP